MSSRRTLLSNAPPSAQRPRGSARPSASASPATHGAAPSGRSGQSQAQSNLPPYTAPVCPLDQTARRALSELSQNDKSETIKYDKQLENSIKLLGAAISEVNERYLERKTRLKHRLESQRQQGRNENEVPEVDAETETMQQSVRTLASEVPELTAACDDGVREVIDWRVELEDGRLALESMAQEVEDESRDAERKSAAIRERKERIREARERRMENPEDEPTDEEEEDVEEEDEENQITGSLKRLRNNKRKLRSDYEEKSLYQRYGLNNDYINFKKLWHLALQPPGAEEKPLPDATRWFDDRNGNEDDDDEEDEDLVVAGEIKSLRCPLSQVVMTEPYTNHGGCKHTFQKVAIVEYLSKMPGRRGTCPQTGCGKVVHLKDFSLDQYVLRQIQRSQRHERGEEEDEEDYEEDPDESMQVTSQRSIKKERRRRDDTSVDEDEDMDEA